LSAILPSDVAAPSGETELALALAAALALALAALLGAVDEALPLPPHPTSTNASANAQHANATTGDFFMASTFHIKFVMSRAQPLLPRKQATEHTNLLITYQKHQTAGVRLRCLIFMEEGAPLVLQLIV